jgi:hypothetical protein
VLKKDAEMAPINWFRDAQKKSTSRKATKCTKRRTGANVIDVDKADIICLEPAEVIDLSDGEDGDVDMAMNIDEPANLSNIGSRGSYVLIPLS